MAQESTLVSISRPREGDRNPEREHHGERGPADDQAVRVRRCPHADGLEHRLVHDLYPFQHRTLDLLGQDGRQAGANRAARRVRQLAKPVIW